MSNAMSLRKRLVSAVAALLVTAALAHASGYVAVYALVDRVVFEPDASKPDRVQIWGVFQLYGMDAPQRGYLYFAVPAAWAGQVLEAQARKEWNDLKSVAGTRQVVSFGELSFAATGPAATVRKPGEKPEKPDLYTFGTGVVKLRPDTDYPPVKLLLEFK